MSLAGFKKQINKANQVSVFAYIGLPFYHKPYLKLSLDIGDKVSGIVSKIVSGIVK